MSEPEVFPIMFGGYRVEEKINELRRGGGPVAFVCIPWSMIAPHEKQARINHGQTLKGLAGRGGLSASEAVAVIDGREWRNMSEVVANSRLLVLWRAWSEREQT